MLQHKNKTDSSTATGQMSVFWSLVPSCSISCSFLSFREVQSHLPPCLQKFQAPLRTEASILLVRPTVSSPFNSVLTNSKNIPGNHHQMRQDHGIHATITNCKPAVFLFEVSLISFYFSLSHYTNAIAKDLSLAKMLGQYQNSHKI